MNRPPALLWIVLLLLLLPTAAGRFLLDLAGGLLLVVLALPLVLAGAGWIGWKLLQSRLVSCPVCGAASLSVADCCSVCGTPFGADASSSSASVSQDSTVAPASDVTIDITAQDVGSEASD